MADSIFSLTVGSTDVATLSLTTEGSAQAAITGSQDLTNGRLRRIAAKAKTDLVEQRIDGSVDGTTDTSATVGVTFVRVRVGCYGSALTQQPCGLISDLTIYSDVPQ